MRVSVAQIKNGVLKYVDQEIIGKTPGLTQWVLIAAVSLYAQKADEVLGKFVQSDMAKTLDLVDEQGMVDLDKVKDCFETAASRTGAVVQRIPMLGNVTFTADDIRRLYELIATIA